MRHCLCERSNRAAPGHLDAIANIERYATRGREAFESDELIQNWFIRHLQIIGEAARALPQEIRDREQIIPWSKIMERRSKRTLETDAPINYILPGCVAPSQLSMR
jgi:hypothetical protein